MTLDTAVVLAALVLVLLWPLHQQLTIRALRHSLRRQRDQLAQHRRAIIQLQGAAIQPPTSIGAPMPSVTGTHRAIGHPMATINVQARNLDCPAPNPRFVVSKAGLRSLQTDTDPTLRLARPPALTDLQHVLTQAGRALTATEIATKLGLPTWELIPAIDRDLAAGRIQAVPGHTAGRTAYRLADQTERMPHGMSVLPGVVR